MRSIEVTGKTVEEAKQQAAEELGVPVDQIEFEILEEPGKHFLGLSHSPARVKATADVEPEEAVAEKKQTEEVAKPVSMEASGDTAVVANELVELLGQIFEAMEVEAKAEVTNVSEEEILIDVTGGDAAAILIGKGGQTLDALQYLLGIAANRKYPQKLRVLLDVDGYRRRHDEMLIAKAMDYVRHVKETGEEAVFDPMSSRDRRTVHMALKDDPDVYTYSEGEGPDRHLVISPRKEGETPEAE